ncbi:type II secretion system protein GspK [Agaribacter marinus]|uniref:Type II secretion system protein K n=1 Tax=Agaribacter marinus TaxID=1431249 RepID=A0AA37T326_9ALTE|nr:type II secretion system protein GspK [Agaribacter marinus]GLR70870.1 hypothetical protein GCM10007852_17780 [Agaribacter marinus]
MSSDDMNDSIWHKSQSGVVLVAVIVFLLITSVLIAGASGLMERRLNIAKKAQDNAYALATMHAKLNEIIYLLATQRSTIAGLSQGTAINRFVKNSDGFFENTVTGDELRVDSYVYKHEGINFYIQNTDGLIPINTPGQNWLKLFLRKQALSTYSLGILLDSLNDYADEDRLQKPLGKEQFQQYHPKNYLLQACSELALVYGWQAYLERDSYLMHNCNLNRTPTINLNAMPVKLWRDIFGGSADKLINQRDNGNWFVIETDAALVEPSILTMPEELYSANGGNQFVVRLYTEDAALSRRIKLGRGVAKPFTQMIAK